MHGDIISTEIKIEVQNLFFIMKIQTTVESLVFKVAQFLWYSCVALSYEFTSLTKTNFERICYLIETENQRIHEIISPRITYLNRKSSRGTF